VAFDWISQAFNWILPHQDLAVSRNSDQAHFLLKRAHRLKRKPNYFPDGLSVEIFISIGLADNNTLIVCLALLDIPNENFSVHCSTSEN